MARRKIVAGNWKMNMTPSEAVKLCDELKDLVKSDDVDVVYCVPAIDIVPVVEAVKGTNVEVGAENMYFEEKGAFTGEISASMLKDAGVKYVIIGHSERRDYFKEDDALLNRKVKKALEAGLVPILCCGETLEQREMGVTMDWIRLQIKSIVTFISLCSKDSPQQRIGTMPASNAFRTFLFRKASSSLKYSLLSEWPMITYSTPASFSMGAEISPVYAPLSSI